MRFQACYVIQVVIDRSPNTNNRWTTRLRTSSSRDQQLVKPPPSDVPTAPNKLISFVNLNTFFCRIYPTKMLIAVFPILTSQV